MRGRVITAVIGLLGLGGCLLPGPGVDGGAGCPVDAGHVLSAGAALAIVGDPGGDSAMLGYGDPSVVYAAGADAGFMSYTAVGAGRTLITRVATSSDHGATWTWAGTVNSTDPVTVTTTDTSVCQATTCPGAWAHETSSLVDDPTDPDPSRRFKVFAHTYFHGADDSLRYEIGRIDLWTSGTVAVGATWSLTRLLGWTSSSPASSDGARVVVTTDATLSPLLGGCTVLTEPGAMVRGGTLELALGCIRVVSPTDVPIEVVMIRSTDHGATWSPVGKVLDLADAASLGAAGPSGPQLNAPDLFAVGGQYYLFVTPNGPVSNLGDATNGYRGCLAIPFADLETGKVARCGTGPAPVDLFQGSPGLFNGACTWAEGASASGVMMLTASLVQQTAFQLNATGLAAP